MARRGKGWLAGAARALDLPPEAFGETRIEMVGRRRLLIENHRGLLAFSSREVVVDTPNGRVAVAGRGFVIEAIRPDRLRIAGLIEEVRLGQRHGAV
ncbi:YabP/YqfC family sporulation protein [Geochorda subterranea]|uniref:YabP/YqfC family sporulation protein n=1 Tax=Geochorda subterranea TaxID=3109564 RepID=A0ABZ1BL15_9FIRM|nr:YabP/YqfC family sporulation protein [Limnochorda sp. LNt]WRP13509.1 YabP/YqfC family sporulation protein [Limnochorda sp. LNt]